jgi:hypothetical protein
MTELLDNGKCISKLGSWIQIVEPQLVEVEEASKILILHFHTSDEKQAEHRKTFYLMTFAFELQTLFGYSSQFWNATLREKTVISVRCQLRQFF